MHLTASGLAALGCEMHQTPSALGFPTQLPGSILIPISKLGKPLWSATSLLRVCTNIYFLYQLRKMLILLISSYCKMCTLPTLQSRVFVCYEQYKHARLYCWQWTHFTMGPNEQNQHFAQLRQNICLPIYVVVLLTCLPSLDGKLERFVTKKWQK